MICCCSFAHFGLYGQCEFLPRLKQALVINIKQQIQQSVIIKCNRCKPKKATSKILNLTLEYVQLH